MLKNRYLKLGLLYTFLTLALLTLIFKFGITAAVKISDLIQGNKPLPTDSLYSNTLSAPQLYSIPEATNSASLPVSGYSIPNGKVDIYLNDLNVQTFETDAEGKFDGLISLSLGTSKIYAIARDTTDQQSPPSDSWSVFYEKSAPTIEITEPANGSLIKRNPNIEIKGKVAKTSRVTINEHQVIVNEDGSFAYPYKLQNGENVMKVICSDPAANTTELEWKINFQP